jgi:hypothetical protein
MPIRSIRCGMNDGDSDDDGRGENLRGFRTGAGDPRSGLRIQADGFLDAPVDQEDIFRCSIFMTSVWLL